jgi:hypothetical protein
VAPGPDARAPPDQENIVALDPKNLQAFLTEVQNDVASDLAQVQDADLSNEAANVGEQNTDQAAANDQDVVTAANNESQGGDGGVAVGGAGGSGGDIGNFTGKTNINFGDGGDGGDGGDASADGGASTAVLDQDVDADSIIDQFSDQDQEQENDQDNDSDQDEDSDLDVSSFIS